MTDVKALERMIETQTEMIAGLMAAQAHLSGHLLRLLRQVGASPQEIARVLTISEEAVWDLENSESVNSIMREHILSIGQIALRPAP